MKVIILCGGKGVRAFPFTEYLPKPMLPIGGTPVIVHIMRNYMAQGINEFILAAGHRKTVLEDYFYQKDMGAKVQIVDTGEDADTGERIYACRDYVDDVFMATYGDGLSNVPMKDLLAFHKEKDALATITTVPLYSQYGIVEAEASGTISSLREKPRMQGHWINAGFFVFQKEAFKYWTGKNLESEVFSNLVSMGKMAAFQHEGFFKSMDSYKDNQEFESLYDSDEKPWIVKTEKEIVA